MTTMTGNFKYYIKQPKDCDEFELSKFHELVLKGKKVQKAGLRRRIENCKLLGYCSIDKQIVAVSSLKQPEESHVKKIIEDAKIDRLWQELKFEIGYSFTEENYRRNGINGEIKKRILEQVEVVDGVLFSTTAIQSSQNFLLDHGFKNIGQSYDGKHDKGIKYYERK